MHPDTSGATSPRPRRRRALAVVSLALLPILALTVFASHLAAQTAHASGNVSFAPVATYSLGVSTPRSAAIGDLNGDGHPDVVTANFNTNIVTVLLGNSNGDGAFTSSANYAVGTAPKSVAIGDLNGDGHPDLVVANQSSNNVTVLMGSSNGDGAFTSSANYAVGAGPVSVAIGDLNGDGHPDLVTANVVGSNISVLLGSSNGDGTFATAVNYAIGASAVSVAVADLNGDGHPDLVTANSGGNDVSVLLGDGTGVFAAAQSFAVGASPASVAIGDLNSDGKPDVVTANSGSGDVSVLLNTTSSGTPTPTPTVSPTPGGGGSNTAQVTVALAPGELSATTNAAPSLSATLNGQDQTLNYALPITVTDGTATGNGWNLTITSTQFSTSGPPVNTLPTTASTTVSVASVCASGTCVDPTNTVSYPLTIPAGASAPTPVKLFNAAVGTGMGIFTVTPSVNILIPATIVAGTYTSTITLAIVSGP